MGIVRLTGLDSEARAIVQRLTGQHPDTQLWDADVLRHTVDGVSDEHAAAITGVQLYTCHSQPFAHLRIDPGATP